MFDKFDFDLSRLHFTGRLPYPQYLQVLRASSVHVYLTRPFVLSWSMLEAMSTGCVIVASSTPPVTEVIHDGENGMLIDLFSSPDIVEKVERALDNPDDLRKLRTNAREIIMRNYNLSDLLPKHLEWIQKNIKN
jgi:glycosyltransferase involved in cell wall biosynthesis